MVQMEINPGRSLSHVFDSKIKNGAGYLHGGDADSSGACDVGVGNAWYCMVLHGIARCCMVLPGIA